MKNANKKDLIITKKRERNSTIMIIQYLINCYAIKDEKNDVIILIHNAVNVIFNIFYFFSSTRAKVCLLNE